MRHRRRVFLVVAAVDAVVDGGTLRRRGHLDATVGLALAAHGLAHGHRHPRQLSRLGPSRERHDHEAERRVLCLQLIGLSYVGTARGISQAARGSIERHHRGSTGLELISVLHAVVAVGIVVLRTEVNSRGGHLVRSHKQQSPTLVVSERKPAHLLLCAVFLRQDIILALVGHRALIESWKTGLLAVAIAVPRAASQPCQLLEGRRHLQAEAQLRDNHARGRRPDHRAHQYLTVGTHVEAQRHTERCTVLTRMRTLQRHRGHLAVGQRLSRHGRALHRELAQSHIVPGGSLTAVVVGRQTEGIQQQRLAHQRHAVIDIACQRALALRERGLEQAVLHRHRGRGGTHRQGVEGLFAEHVQRRLHCCPERQLFFCHHVAGIGPSRLFLLCGLEIDERLLRGIHSLNSREIDGHSRAVASSHLLLNRPLSEHLALLVLQLIAHVVGGRRQESQLILHAELAVLDVDGAPLQRLIHLLGIIRLGRQTPVGTHQTVDTEVAIVRIVAEVAAVGPVLFARRALRQQALILEVPDELACQAGIFLVEVEHVAHVAHRVAHRVRVLTLDVGFLSCLALARRANPLDVLIAAIHS